jgi:DNA-binding MarR family transcriptional regulator
MDDHVVIGRQLGLFLRLVERMFADLKEPPNGLDLDRAAYVLLGRIAGDGPARLSTLADDVRLDLSTISRQVAALEAAGLVTRTTDSSDRRAWLIKATDAGYQTFVRNREVWLATMRDLLADWTDEERAEFARLFIRLNDAITAREDARGDARGETRGDARGETRGDARGETRGDALSKHARTEAKSTKENR